MVHFFESLTGGGIYGNFSAILSDYFYLTIFVKIDGHRTSGRFKRAEGM